MQVIQGRKDDAFARRNISIGSFHSSDNGCVVLEDMSVAIDDSRAEPG
jgi:hypothetical protein